jgi:predicted PurR-regulated permease PerM
LLERAQSFLIEHHLLRERITLEQAVRNAPGTSSDAVGTVATALTAVVEGIFGVMTILIPDVLSAARQPDDLRRFRAPLRARRFGRVSKHVARQIRTKISAWLSGQLILAGSIGAERRARPYLLGVPYFYVLALVAAVGEIIPVIGPILSAIPAVCRRPLACRRKRRFLSGLLDRAAADGRTTCSCQR